MLNLFSGFQQYLLRYVPTSQVSSFSAYCSGQVTSPRNVFFSWCCILLAPQNPLLLTPVSAFRRVSRLPVPPFPCCSVPTFRRCLSPRFRDLCWWPRFSVLQFEHIYMYIYIYASLPGNIVRPLLLLLPRVPILSL